MRLAWFTPLAPVRSGISAYSREILPRLGRTHTIDVYLDRVVATTEETAAGGADTSVRIRSAFAFPFAHDARPYDLIVYQLGNATCHDYMWPYLLRYPGLVVLHDGQLHHSRALCLLRAGRSPDYAAELREKQFDVLKGAQGEVLNLTHWHQFLSALVGAGFRSGEMISSQNALLYAYAFYLIGRKRFGVAEHQLQKAIGRWFFFTSLTGRYTSSPESVMDGDLNRLDGLADGAAFVALLDQIIASELTSDYWGITLPAALDSSSARNPQLFAFVAAQNRLNAPVLFSHKKVGDLIDPAIKSHRKALERHHLFPRAWLERNGVDDLKQINQIESPRESRRLLRLRMEPR